MERIYAVEFNTYTNCLKDTVSDGNKNIGETKYIHLPKDVPFLIKENDHAMDDIRYFCNTIMKNKVRKESNYTPIFM